MWNTIAITEKMTTQETKKELLKKLFSTFSIGIRTAKADKPRTWLEEKGLDYENLQIGFSSGQHHHRKDQAYINNYISVGVLKKSDAPVREPGMQAHTCFGNYAIVFPLKDQGGNIVNLYAIRIDRKPEVTEHVNNDGLYPAHPNPLTTRLYLTKNILDAATLLQSGVMENRDAVVALKDGELTEHHIHAIKNLKNLEQIILIN